MLKVFILFMLFFLAGYPSMIYSAEFFSDSPEDTRESAGPFKAADTFEQALQIWKTPGDIHAWIAANFSYDLGRATRLSETQRRKNEQFSIYDPSEFFKMKTGVCVDLTRFGVETLRRIDPESDPKYLMIEFGPIQVAGSTLRFHWLASFKRDGKIYFFADSKRPGHMAGPYHDTQDFIDEYAQYRGRRIVAFRELESYKKQKQTRKMKLQAPEKSP